MTAVTNGPPRPWPKVRPVAGKGSARNVLVHAANMAAGARKAAGVTVTIVHVAGWCAWKGCRQPFDVVHDVRNRDGWPTTCSNACARAVIRARTRARRRAEEEAAAAAIEAAIEAAARLCRMCWSRDRYEESLMCPYCFNAGFGWAKRMCDGKRRLGMDAAIDRAGAYSMVDNNPISAYFCPPCGWWHVGNERSDESRLVRKQRTLAATLWVQSVAPDRLARARIEWEP